MVDPETVERVALESIPPGKDSELRRFGVELLGLLTAQGSKSAELALYSVASGQDPALSEDALTRLYGADHSGVYESLYARKSSEGNIAALRMIGTWPDPLAEPMLKDLVARHPGLLAPACNLRMAAEQALQRLELINSPEYDHQIASILTGSDRQRIFWISWALKMAQVRPPPNLMEICRQRLDAGIARALEVEQSGLSAQWFKPGHAERGFLTAPHVNETGDPYYDELFLLYARTGGPLQSFEKGRLTAFGFLGDPKERLEQLMGAQEK